LFTNFAPLQEENKLLTLAAYGKKTVVNEKQE
jgi:hypothetical protein